MKVNLEDLVGTIELAQAFDVEPNTVTTWAKRHADFPEPVRRLGSGRLWLLPEVEKWAQNRKGGRAPVTAVVNR